MDSRQPGDAELQRLLREQGFDDPERWVQRAREDSYRMVPADRLSCCPECGGPIGSVIGRYVHYSNFARLITCQECGLWYSDLRLNRQTIQGHVERAYKDEGYFSRRTRIFQQVVSLVSREARPGAHVLDIGGAKGHLLVELQRLRSDLQLTVSDLSEGACQAATTRFGFRSILGSIVDLADLDERFDVLILCDVIYYEPNLQTLWRSIERLAGQSSVVVIRIPNKAFWIRILGQPFEMGPQSPTRIRFFNPEHLYVFSSRYITKRIRDLGFNDVQVLPSQLLGDGPLAWLGFQILRGVGRIIPGVDALTPSMIIVARRGEGSEH